MSKKRKTTAYAGYQNAIKRFDVEPSPGRERNRIHLIDRGRDTFNAGELVPFFWMPVHPGDNLYFSPSVLIRMSNPFVNPLMDEISCNIHFFMSYDRFVCDYFRELMGEFNDNDSDYDESGDNYGADAITEPAYNSPGEYEYPTLVFNKNSDNSVFEIGSIYDHFGLPYKLSPNGTSYEIQPLLFRHYNHIWNSFYRDENLQRKAPVPKGPGPDKLTQYRLLPVLKYKDYFTGSLPFLQKGPDVSIGLTGDLPVHWDLTSPVTESNHVGLSKVNNQLLAFTLPGNWSNIPNETTGYLNVPGQEASAVSLAQIRLAFQLQRFYEGQARSGSRYIEYVKFMFNVDIPDIELERPQFIGGTKTYINVNPVTQTSSNSDQPTPLGALAAFGVTYHRDGSCAHCYAREHGYVIGFVSARTNLSYSQGLDRDFQKKDRFDTYVPTLAHLAEQPLYNNELCCTGIPEYDSGTFGYIGRYDNLRTHIARNKGWFRPDSPLTLASYHLGEYWDLSTPGTNAQGFPGLPHLNTNFIVQPKQFIDRALNISSEAPGVPQFLMDYSVTVKGTSVISKHGIPGYADHF